MTTRHHADKMDEYREAFDVHGETTECSQCECELDVLTVEHWGDTGHGERVPICDRCYWEDWHASHDPDDVSYEEEEE